MRKPKSDDVEPLGIAGIEPSGSEPPVGGNGDGDGGPIDPNTVEPVADTGSRRGGRRAGAGRKSGSSPGTGSASKPRAAKPAKEKANVSLDVPSLSLCVAFASGFIAKTLKQPELAFDENEQRATAEALANVGQYYNIPVSPVMQAWIALGMTVGGIVTGKVAAIKIKKSMGGNVSPFTSKPKPQSASNDFVDLEASREAAE